MITPIDVFLLALVALALWKIDRLERSLRPRGNAQSIEIYTTINGQIQKVVHVFQSVTESKTYSIKPVDAKGNAAKVDGAPTWALTDESLGTLEVAADGLSAVLTPSGPIGACKLQVKADADMGEGVKEIFGEADLEFVAGEAVAIEIAQA